MPTVKNPDKEYTYILTCDRELPQDKQTIFYYKIPSLEDQYNALGDGVTLEKGKDGAVNAKVQINKKGEIDLLTGNITRIENLKDEDGKTLTWDGDAANKKKILSVLDGAWRAELADAIRSAGRLTEDDTKNSDSQSR